MESVQKKVALSTLGCKLNFTETSTISRSLTKNGYALTPFTTKADFYIINTCSVTENADRKFKTYLNKAKKLNPKAKNIVIGCYAQLKPEEISDGTYTVTNVGNFGSIMGTPIINQPQVGIIAIGVIRKLPSVIETDKGDFVGIRKKLILSHTYDHRIINGSIGGNFVKRVAEHLEAWDMNQTI